MIPLTCNIQKRENPQQQRIRQFEATRWDDMTVNWHKRTSWDDGNVLNLVCDNGGTTL